MFPVNVCAPPYRRDFEGSNPTPDTTWFTLPSSLKHWDQSFFVQLDFSQLPSLDSSHAANAASGKREEERIPLFCRASWTENHVFKETWREATLLMGATVKGEEVFSYVFPGRRHLTTILTIAAHPINRMRTPRGNATEVCRSLSATAPELLAQDLISYPRWCRWGIALT